MNDAPQSYRRHYQIHGLSRPIELGPGRRARAARAAAWGALAVAGLATAALTVGDDPLAARLDPDRMLVAALAMLAAIAGLFGALRGVLRLRRPALTLGAEGIVTASGRRIGWRSVTGVEAKRKSSRDWLSITHSSGEVGVQVAGADAARDLTQIVQQQLGRFRGR